MQFHLNSATFQQSYPLFLYNTNGVVRSWNHVPINNGNSEKGTVALQNAGETDQIYGQGENIVNVKAISGRTSCVFSTLVHFHTGLPCVVSKIWISVKSPDDTYKPLHVH